MTSRSMKLHLAERVRVGDESLEGHVELNVTGAAADGIENVRVKLRGSIYVEITVTKHRQSGNTSFTNRDTQRRRVELLRSDASIWTRDDRRQPTSDVLHLPFRFQLPPNLPPSFHCDGSSQKGIISYSIEVVGDRPGLFKSNRRIGAIFPIIPAATPDALDLRRLLISGWSGNWKGVEHRAEIRRGIWGPYSQVKTTLVLPVLPALPMSTEIPFRIVITTDTKPVQHSQGPTHSGKPVFPEPPSNFSELEFMLIRHVRMVTATRSDRCTETVLLLGQTGATAGSRQHEMERDPPEWIPSEREQGKGIWRRTVRMQGVAFLPVPPTFSSDILSWDYAFRLLVPFPGIGNDIQSDSPVCIVSSFDRTPTANYADIPPPGPPPVLDLPPAYWQGEFHDWDSREK